LYTYIVVYVSKNQKVIGSSFTRKRPVY